MKQPSLRILAALLCLLLLLLCTASAFADFGDIGGDADWGGGGDDWGGGGDDWGGGWDDGGGGGWAWDDDDDYSGSSRSGPMSGAELVVLIIVIVFMLIVAAAKANESMSNSGRSAHHVVRRSASQPVVVSDTPQLRPISQYSKLDPEFDAAALTQKLSNLFIQMQQCWQARNIESLRPYFTDTYFSQLDRQLETFRRKGITNYIDHPVVLSVKLDGFCQSGGDDHVYATVQARMVDYQIKDDSGKLVKGSMTAEKFMTYRYHLIRPSGQHSSSLGGVRSISCPHCGAPLSINESAKCPYCDSVVTVDRYEFVISQIEGVAQRTVR